MTLLTVDLELHSHIWMYGNSFKCVVDDLDSVEPIAEQIDAVNKGLA